MKASNNLVPLYNKGPVLSPHCRIYNRVARYVTQREIRHLRGRKSGALCLPWDWVGQPFLRQLPRLRINQGLLTITQVRLSQNTTWSSFIFYLLFQISARKEKNIAKGTTDPRVEFILPKSYCKFKRKSWSNFIFRILTKHQLEISTKHQHFH